MRQARSMAAALGCAAFAMLMLTGGLQAQDKAQIAKEREELMKQMWPKYVQDMAAVARGRSTDLAPIPEKAAGAAAAVRKFVTMFPAGSGRDAVPTTRAKPEIWTQRAEFDATADKLASAFDKLGETAKGGNLDAYKAQFAVVADACGGCHGGPKEAGGKFRFEEK